MIRIEYMTTSPHYIRLALFSVVASLPVACSGGGHAASTNGGPVQNVLPAVDVSQATPSTPASTGAADAAVSVHLHYVLPANLNAASRKARVLSSQQQGVQRSAQYISTSNTLISITVTPLGGTPTTLAATPCTPGACAVSFTALPGPNTLAFTLTDGIGKVLSSFSTVSIIQPATENTLNFTANPVVNSVVLQLASGAVNAGTPTNDALTVIAQDKDLNTIVGPARYVDINGNPVTLRLSVTNSQAGGKGNVNIQGPLAIADPNSAPIYAHYDGNWLASSTISVTSSSSAITSLTNATVTTTPRVATTYSIPGAGNQPTGIATGPDGNIWFTYSPNYIERMTLSGSFTKYSVPSGNSYPSSLTVGPDGNLWFSEADTGFACTPGFGNLANIGRITTGGAITEFTTPNGTGCDAATRINLGAFGPDGNYWYPEYNIPSIARMSTSGAVTRFSLPGKPGAVTLGADGNMWVAEFSGSRIWRLTTSGLATQFTIPGARGDVGGMVAGPDGNVWFTEENGDRIGRITPNGTITEFPVPVTSAELIGIIVGPDANLWFVDDSNNKIGRVTPSGTVTEWNAPATPQQLTLGSDGNIWFVEDTGKTVARFVY